VRRNEVSTYRFTHFENETDCNAMLSKINENAVGRVAGGEKADSLSSFWTKLLP
jgi:hypothetical protein